MPQVTFDVESAAEPLLIVSTQDAGGHPTNHQVDLEPVGAERRTGSITVPSSQNHFLTWIFTGNPGTKYKITLEPKDKIALKRSDNPIESSIATSRFMGTGSDQFEVVP
jgi:hypothetical protein